MTNHIVIRDFWEENNLMNNHSIIRFKCTFKIKTQSDFSTSENEAMIWLDSGSVNKVQIIDFDKDQKKFPTDFWFTTGVFTNDKNVLVINGEHPNPSIGEYIATIIAHHKV